MSNATALSNLAATAIILSKPAQGALVAIAQDAETKASAREAARHDLIQSNIRLAFKVAKKHVRRGLQFDDLMSACVEGILTAVNKFDPTKGASFTTYARQWMTAKCQEHVQANAGLVHCGSRTSKKLWASLQKARKVVGQDATMEQIANHLELDTRDVEACMRYMTARGASMDAPLSDDGGTIATLIGDGKMSQETKMERTQNSASIQDAVTSFSDNLKARQRDILNGRIVNELLGKERKAADSFGVTKQRCGQIENDLRGKLAAHFTRQFGTEGVSDMIKRSF
jgi:RNA polymerase sigma factor (sigma-70 family)